MHRLAFVTAFVLGTIGYPFAQIPAADPPSPGPRGREIRPKGAEQASVRARFGQRNERTSAARDDAGHDAHDVGYARNDANDGISKRRRNKGNPHACGPCKTAQ